MSDVRTITPETSQLVGSHLATSLLSDRRCGLCEEDLTSVGFRAGPHLVEVLSCGPCGWHARQIDGIDATLDEVCDLFRGALPTDPGDRGRLPATWDREPPGSGRPTRSAPPVAHRGRMFG